MHKHTHTHTATYTPKTPYWKTCTERHTRVQHIPVQQSWFTSPGITKVDIKVTVVVNNLLQIDISSTVPHNFLFIITFYWSMQRSHGCKLNRHKLSVFTKWIQINGLSSVWVKVLRHLFALHSSVKKLPEINLNNKDIRMHERHRLWQLCLS